MLYIFIIAVLLQQLSLSAYHVSSYHLYTTTPTTRRIPSDKLNIMYVIFTLDTITSHENRVEKKHYIEK